MSRLHSDELVNKILLRYQKSQKYPWLAYVHRSKSVLTHVIRSLHHTLMSVSYGIFFLDVVETAHTFLNFGHNRSLPYKILSSFAAIALIAAAITVIFIASPYVLAVSGFALMTYNTIVSVVNFFKTREEREQLSESHSPLIHQFVRLNISNNLVNTVIAVASLAFVALIVFFPPAELIATIGLTLIAIGSVISRIWHNTKMNTTMEAILQEEKNINIEPPPEEEITVHSSDLEILSDLNGEQASITESLTEVAPEIATSPQVSTNQDSFADDMAHTLEHLDKPTPEPEPTHTPDNDDEREEEEPRPGEM